jgi:hypothetical protein
VRSYAFLMKLLRRPRAAVAINRVPASLFRLCSVRAEKMTEDDHRQSPASCQARPMLASMFAARFQPRLTNFTIFEGTSEIQRMIIGCAVTVLDVR